MLTEILLVAGLVTLLALFWVMVQAVGRRLGCDRQGDCGCGHRCARASQPDKPSDR